MNVDGMLREERVGTILLVGTYLPTHLQFPPPASDKLVGKCARDQSG